MKWSEWLAKWDMKSLKMSAPFLAMEWAPQEADKTAAWEMYIELLTGSILQPLDSSQWGEKNALDTVSSLFELTRKVLKSNTRNCMSFAKITIIILNQVVKPFTTKWHTAHVNGALTDTKKCAEFRKELPALQKTLGMYIKMLGDMAGIEDLTALDAKPTPVIPSQNYEDYLAHI